MSWNKNTINHSKLDVIKETLQKLGVEYKVEILGYVNGRGLNDGPGTKYAMRKLVYEKGIVIESIFRTNDCDDDDLIYSHEYCIEGKSEDWVPEGWEIEEWEEE